MFCSLLRSPSLVWVIVCIWPPWGYLLSLYSPHFTEIQIWQIKKRTFQNKIVRMTKSVQNKLCLTQLLESLNFP